MLISHDCLLDAQSLQPLEFLGSFDLVAPEDTDGPAGAEEVIEEDPEEVALRHEIADLDAELRELL